MNIIRKARISADKRSVDAYGRSIELALAGRSVEGYTYGSEGTITYQAYSVGDEVTYNNINYYVIKDSGASEESVTFLKAEPLSASEITTYSAETGAQTGGNGGMQYHSSSNNYETSYIKTTVDAWKQAQAPAASEARLITYEELEDNLGYDHGTPEASWINVNPEYTPSWVYNNNFGYWTMSQYEDSASGVWGVTSDGGLDDIYVSYDYRVVRPVIVLSKSNISS